MRITGATCEHLRDAGVRAVVWTYADGSFIEAGVYEGKLSGLTVSGGQAERHARAVRSEDDDADFLHSVFGDAFVTVDDVSDRECLWRWEDGRLSVTFERGTLTEAMWFPADGDAVMLAEANDEIDLLLSRLGARLPSERYRALTALVDTDDPRVADAVVAMLQTETDKTNRGKAGLLLAQIGDRRANRLLLQDLEEPIVGVDVIRALGRIGDLGAERALRDALHRQGSYRIQAEIQSARARIRDRLGMPPPDRR